MTTVADQPWFQDAALAKVFTLLNADGGEVRVVGGAVRNSLLGSRLAISISPQRLFRPK